MAVTLLRVLVLGVIAAAADDVPITWLSSPRASVPCVVPDADRIPARRPPPPLEAEDRPRPKPYVWRKGDEEVKRVLSNGTLEVSKKKDGSSEGVYQCTVRHHAGLVLGYPVQLKFAYLDKQFSVHPENATAWRGQPFVLNCSISSGPAAAISWQKDGEPLPQNNRYTVLKNQLLITDVTGEDSGLYRCKATNSHANRTRYSHEGKLQVEEYPGNPDTDPAMLPVHHEKDIAVPRGSTVVLPCPVTGWPRPKLIWEFSQPGERTSELEATDEVLILRDVGPEQEGVYTCTVEGNSDLVKTFAVSLTEPARITVHPTSKQTFRASTVRFNCTAAGKPAPTVTWYKDGKPLTLAGRIVVLPSVDGKRLELLIRSVTSEDAGVYQCFAQTPHSTASAWATLNVTGAGAAAPTGVTCGAAGARAVLVRWPRVRADVMAYTVQITTPGGISLPGQPVIGIEDIITVAEPLTPYGFQVRAYIKSPTTNRNVASDMSESVTCQGQGVPIKLARQNDDILVSWKQFADQTPGVLQWILQYKVENSTDELNVTLDGKVTNYTIKGSTQEPLQVRVLGTKYLPWLHQNLTLVPWTSTSVAVRAPDAGEVKAIPEDVEVTDIRPEGFTVRWRCEEADLSPDIFSYMVCTRRIDGNEDCVETQLKSVRIDKLSPSTMYEVRVQARVRARDAAGDFSAPITITTPSDGPQRFKDLSAKLVNATTLRVSWNSVPGKYTIHYSNERNVPLNQWSSVDTMGNTVLLTGLDLTKEMYVMVTGYEPLGRSQILNVTVPETKELQYWFTRSGLTVTWRGEGPRQVMYSQNLTQSLDKWPTINVTTNIVHITGLEPEQSTYVVVAAPGPSLRSQVVTVPPRPPDHSSFYLSIGIGCGVVLLCLLAVAAICIWRRRKRSQSPVRSRRRNLSSPEGNEEEGAEMKNIGNRLANGGGSKDAGEPLLNGHVHITENPNQSKTPNGRMRKGRRYEAAFDVARYEDPDSTLETVLDPDTSASTTFNLLDTSRRPEYDLCRSSRDISSNNSFNKLPDDNMNSELTRSTDFQLDNSKILPTLQPNG
ncbi:immunoglobulin superfamily DCC subclass member 4 isoform X2 [Helicoverpa armigera]|uniref:immunoglobulin superfamily DCC subclass member 4 isoform X2 n=1 Tax=Helicoverpa armigera TaxID=29058 RepID=UPI003083B16B